MAYLIISLIIIVVFPLFVNVAIVGRYLSFNYVFIFSALLLLALIFGIVWITRNKNLNVSDKVFHFAAVISAVLLLTYQIFLSLNVLFLPIGDVYGITFEGFTKFSCIDPVSPQADEISLLLQRYPNLAFMAGMSVQIYKIVSLFNVEPEILSRLCYLIVQIISCLCVSLSILMGSYIVRKITKINILGLVAFVIGGILIGLSLMVTVPYSDTFGIFFTTIILFSYVCINNTKLKSAIIVVASVIGYFVKPTVLAVFVAVLVVEFWRLCAAKKILKFFVSLKNPVVLRKFLINFSIVLSSFIVAIVFVFCVKNIGLEKNHDAEFGPSHYIMMGLNTRQMGQYSEADSNISAECSTYEERLNTNLDIAGQRLSELGVPGLLKLYGYKTLTNYGAGNFISPGVFDLRQYSDNSFIKAFYGIDTSVKNNPDLLTPFNVVTQIIWFTILLLSVILLYMKYDNKIISVIIISILIISLFNMIMEASQRYLFIYSVFFVILAVIAIWQICVNIKQKEGINGN